MALTEQLQPYLEPLRQRYAQSMFPAFFAWWYAQLTSFLPERWRDTLAVGETQLYVQQDEDSLVAYGKQLNDDHEVARVAWSDADDAAGALHQQLDDDTQQWPWVLLLDDKHVLRRILQLPAAASGSLRQVLTFELDRQTPFKADEVYFDHRTLPHEKDAKTVPVELVLTPRKYMDDALAQFGGQTYRLSGVDIADAEGVPMGINLLPREQRRRRSYGWLWINLGLAVLAFALLFAFMGKVVSNREAAVAELEQQVNDQRREAKRAEKLRRDLNDAVAGANFLAIKKAEQPSMVMLLSDVTARMPDDTYLTRFHAADGKIELAGESNQAAKLVGLLTESTQVRDAALNGAISPNAQTGKDRFNIRGAYGPKPAEDNDGEQGKGGGQ